MSLIGQQYQYQEEDIGIWQRVLIKLRETKWRNMVSGKKEQRKKAKIPPKKPTNPTTVNKKLLKAQKDKKKPKDYDKHHYEDKNTEEEEISTDEEQARKLGYDFTLINDKKTYQNGPKCNTKDFPKCNYLNLNNKQQQQKKKDRSLSLPVSNQYVMAYKQLLTHKKQRQLLHLPAFDIEELELDDFLKAGLQQGKKMVQFQEFMSFKDASKLNKSILLKIKEQNPHYKNLNFDDIQGGDGVMGILQRKLKKFTKEKFNEKLMMETKLQHNRFVFDQIQQKMQQNHLQSKTQQEKNLQKVFEHNKSGDFMYKTMRSTSFNVQKEKQPIKMLKKKGQTQPLLSPSSSQKNVFLGTITSQDPNLLQDPHMLDQYTEHQKQQDQNTKDDPISPLQQLKKKRSSQPGWWYHMNQLNQENKPQSRDSAGLVFAKNTAYLYGGISNNVHPNVEKLEINKSYKLVKWEPLSLQLNERGSNPNYCYGHSLDLYQQNTLVLFGGQRKFDMFIPKHKQLRNEVWTLNLSENMWKERTTYGIEVSQRQHHATTVLGKYLIVHGGMDHKDNCLKDIYYLNLEKYKWKNLRIKGPVPELALHQSCTVLHSLRSPRSHAFQPLYDLKINPLYDIVYEGIYFFGGFNNNNEINGKLRIIELQRQPVEFIEPETQGVSPQPRHSHSMVFNDKLNILVVHGGQCDVLEKSYLDDTSILYLNNMNWVKIQNLGSKPSPRTRANIGFFDSKIFVFGGLNQDGFLNNDIQILELDKEISLSMYHKHKALMRKHSALKDLINEKRIYKSLREERIQELFLKEQEEDLLSQIYLNYLPQKEEYMKQMYQEATILKNQEDQIQTQQSKENPIKTFMQTKLNYIEKVQNAQYKKHLSLTARQNPSKWVNLLDEQQLDRDQYSQTFSHFPSLSQENNASFNSTFMNPQQQLQKEEGLGVGVVPELKSFKPASQGGKKNLDDLRIQEKKNALIKDLQSINHIMYNVKNINSNIMSKISEITKNTTIVTDIKKPQNNQSAKISEQTQKMNQILLKKQQQKEKEKKISDGDLMKRRMETKRFRMMPIKSSRANSVI